MFNDNIFYILMSTEELMNLAALNAMDDPYNVLSAVDDLYDVLSIEDGFYG